MRFASVFAGKVRFVTALAGLSALPILAGADLPPDSATITARYRCVDGSIVTAVYRQQPAEVTLSLAHGKTLTLPQVRSADGGRYAKGNSEFWNVGNDATLTLGGKATHCTAL